MLYHEESDGAPRPLEEVRAVITALRAVGEWRPIGSGGWAWRSARSTAGINYWPKTGTIQIQGQDHARERLERALALEVRQGELFG